MGVRHEETGLYQRLVSDGPNLSGSETLVISAGLIAASPNYEPSKRSSVQEGG